MSFIKGIKISCIFLLMKAFVFISANAQAIEARQQLPQYVYKTWNNHNGLPQNTVFDMATDTDGYLWIATEEGLASFNGNDFKIINEENTPQLFSNLFQSISLASQGGVWASSRNTVLWAGKNTVQAFDFRNHLNGSWINSISEDESGRLWVGTNSGDLFFLQNDSIVACRGWKNKEANSVQVLTAVSDGLLIGTNNGLYKWRSDFQDVIRLPEFDAVHIESLAIDQDEAIWVGTREHGLICKTADSTTYFRETDGLHELFITSLSIAPNGDVWIGTSSSGLQVYTNGQFISYGGQGFLGNDIKSILVTDQHLTWVGTSGSGLIQMKPAEVQMLSREMGLSSQIILPIYEHSNGDIWVGTAGKGVNRIQNGEVTHYSRHNGLANEIILSIYGTKEAIFIGTANGLNKFNLKTETIDRHYTVEDGLASNTIQALFYDSHQTLWVASRSGGIHQLRADGKIKRVELPASLLNAEFISIFEDRHENIWFGSSGSGMLRIDKQGEIRHYSTRKGLPSNEIHGFYEDREGTLWLGTGKGLVCYLNDEFLLLNKSNGLAFNEIFRIIEDGKGYLWLSGNFGLQQIPLSELESAKRKKSPPSQISVRLFDTSDGMANVEANGGIFPAGWKMQDGSLWFPTVEGIAMVQPDLVNEPAEQVNILIESFRYGHKEHPLSEDIVVPPGFYNIEIEYTSIEFAKPHTVKYYYRLKGLDDKWENVENRRTAYFTSLKPGNYTFEVKARHYGNWSVPARLSFEVKPFFYQTSLFKTGLLTLLFVAGFFVKQYLSKHQQEARLKILVDERTKELKESNERLLKAVNSIEDQNIKLKEIAWTQSHTVRAPLARLLGLIDMIQDCDPSKQNVKELLNHIKSSGQELDSIIHDIVEKAETIEDLEE